MVKIILSSVIATAANGKREHTVSASSLREALDQLFATFGDALKSRIVDDSGNLRRLLSIYVNGRNIRFLNQLDTKLSQDDEVAILPSVSGG
jgi:MoaD family protein